MFTVHNAPRAVRIAGAMVCLQGLAGVVFVVVLLVGGVGGPGNNLYGEAAYFAVLTAGVLAAGIGLVLGMQWARSPVVVVQVLLGGVAWYALGPSSRPEFGVPLLGFCVTVVSLVFSRSARAWSIGAAEDEESR